MGYGPGGARGAPAPGGDRVSFDLTDFRWWINRTGGDVHILTRENGEVVTVPPGTSIEQPISVPTCDSEADFVRKAMELRLEAADRSYFVWQHNRTVCFSMEARWECPARGVPGVSLVSGRRQVWFHPGGHLEVKLA